nr:transposase domain-containing protein [Trinickia violacea]
MKTRRHILRCRPSASIALDSLLTKYVQVQTQGKHSSKAVAEVECLQAYLHYVIERIADHPVNRIDELLPWNVVPHLPAAAKAASIR